MTAVPFNSHVGWSMSVESTPVKKGALKAFFAIPSWKALLTTTLFVAIAGIFLKETLPHVLPVRPLTAGEEKMLRDIFKDSLDYKKLGLHTSKVMDVRENFFGMASEALGTTLVFEGSNYRPDFSAEDNVMKANFFHEVTHVWQHQNCRISAISGGVKNFFSRAAGMKTNDEIYEYDLSKGRTLGDFSIEKQANIIADYAVLVRNGQPPFGAVGTSKAIADYERVLADFMKNPSSTKNLCSKL